MPGGGRNGGLAAVASSGTNRGRDEGSSDAARNAPRSSRSIPASGTPVSGTQASSTSVSGSSTTGVSGGPARAGIARAGASRTDGSRPGSASDDSGETLLQGGAGATTLSLAGGGRAPGERAGSDGSPDEHAAGSDDERSERPVREHGGSEDFRAVAPPIMSFAQGRRR